LSAVVFFGAQTGMSAEKGGELLMATTTSTDKYSLDFYRNRQGLEVGRKL
jgi:hypothetical protein